MSANDPYQSPAQASTAYPIPSQQALKEVLFSFKGRIPRRTYWLYAIVCGLIFGIVVGIAMALFGPKVDPATGEASGGALASLIVILGYIPLLWIGLALQIKRWHDRGKPGVWVLINLIPFVGGIWSFIECGCLRGTVGPNEFGPDPT